MQNSTERPRPGWTPEEMGATWNAAAARGEFTELKMPETVYTGLPRPWSRRKQPQGKPFQARLPL